MKLFKIKKSNIDNKGLCATKNIKKGTNIKKTVSHLQKASEIGGTYSTPPLATIIFVAIKIG